ncbi:hypothetical protein ABQJ48_09475 [Paraburkholderia sp. DGU8]
MNSGRTIADHWAMFLSASLNIFTVSIEVGSSSIVDNALAFISVSPRISFSATCEAVSAARIALSAMIVTAMLPPITSSVTAIRI